MRLTAGLLLAFSIVPAPAQSTIDATNRFAYAANTGWVNLRPSAADGVVMGEKFLSGFADGANTGWIHWGDGTPTNGHTYANNSGTDYGVNHDGAGNLSGFAYSANTGWINFGWAGANDPNRPRFDLLTGNFSGFAYSLNTGWMNLGAGFLTTDRGLGQFAADPGATTTKIITLPAASARQFLRVLPVRPLQP